VIEVPGEGAAVGPEFEVAGRAKADGRRIRVEILSDAGDVMFESRTPVEAADESSYGRFSVTAEVREPAVSGAIVLVYFDAGGVDDRAAAVSRRVVFSDPASVSMSIFFNRMGDDAVGSCANVFPVERSLSGKGSAYRTAIEELIKGPTEEEKAAGYYSSLPKNAVLKSVAADAGGSVTADFSSALVSGSAGSCRQAAVVSQIVATLEQFLRFGTWPSASTARRTTSSRYH